MKWLPMAPNTRVRAIGTVAGRNKYRSVLRLGNSVLSDTVVNGTYKWGGSQYTESEGHPFLRSKEKGMTDLGGNFYTQKREIIAPEHINVQGRYDYPGSPISEVLTYSGACCAVDPGQGGLFSPPWPTESNDIELDALGATAINQVAPTNPVSELTTALVELRREGIPSLPAAQTWASRTATARNAGSEYLNVQFGWRPLISEIQDFGRGVTHAGAVIEQYRRGIGRPTRREFRFPTIHEEKEELIGTNLRPYCQQSSSWWNPTGRLYRTSKMTRERWFSGCFTYYFPSEILGSKKLADLGILAQQLGLEPTPEVVWNVAPWSWAADWFSNTGDVIGNWSKFHVDGLVMRYGYMMETTIIEQTYSLVGSQLILPYTGSVNLQVPNVIVRNTVKKRLKANPYGFGVNWDGLSPFKLSILAALGVSRV